MVDSWKDRSYEPPSCKLSTDGYGVEVMSASVTVRKDGLILLKTLIMAWSKITHKGKKPFKWWVYKILAEFGWAIRNRYRGGYSIYYKYLRLLNDQGFNLYGQPNITINKWKQS